MHRKLINTNIFMIFSHLITFGDHNDLGNGFVFRVENVLQYRKKLLKTKKKQWFTFHIDSDAKCSFQFAFRVNLMRVIGFSL